MDRLHVYAGFTGFIKKNVVMVIAMLAAIVTCFFVPPDRSYLGYFDVKTLTCLFCVLAVVCALKNVKFFKDRLCGPYFLNKTKQNCYIPLV